MLKNKDLLALLIRLFLGYIFFSAGICKLTHGHFGQLIGPPWLEERLTEYGLGLFARVVAVSQVVCGILLLSQRYSLLGTIMLVPMNVAILAVTVSQKWVGTPAVNTFLLLLNLVLLGMQHRRFRFLWRPDQPSQITPTTLDRVGLNIFGWLGLGFGLLTLAAAPYQLLLTNGFGLLAFGAFALAVTRNPVRHRLDILLLALPFFAMAILTLGKVIPRAEWILGGVVLAEALLLPARLYMGRAGIAQAAPAAAALS